MSLPASYFDGMYGDSDDPWGFRTRRYEARKRQLTVACLQSERYESAFEPGCSIGVLSAELAARSDRLLVTDVSARALEQARRVLPDHVEVRTGRMPEDWPEGRFDLVVLSEVAYYLDEEACELLAARACAVADELVAVHWTHPVPDYPLDGDRVHAIVGGAAARAGLQAMVAHREPDFRIDCWCRDGRSLAVRTGLVTE